MTAQEWIIGANVTYVDHPADAVVSQVYDEIKAVMDIPFVPNIFRAMGHQPTALDAKWNCYKAIMFEGTQNSDQLFVTSKNTFNCPSDLISVS